MKQKFEVDSVILEFGTKRVLSDVYLKCETGKITGLLGRNGSGKTCLMKIMYGELEPNDRSVRIDGDAVFRAYKNSECVRYLPQFKYMPKFLSIKRIFSDFRLDFDQFIENFPEFKKYYNTKYKNLSGGEQRIIEIYAIVASRTKFCLLDEPFSHVMPVHVDTMKKIISREKNNKGIVVTDHMYRHIIDICDNLYVIRNGKTHLTKTLQDIETLGYTRIS